MCNLYRTRKSLDEIARLFDAELPDALRGSNLPDEVYPGTPGLVARLSDGTRHLTNMNWGFPFAQKSKKTGKTLKPRPVNNTRADKFDSFFWRYSFEERRCLIPFTAICGGRGADRCKDKDVVLCPRGGWPAGRGRNLAHQR